MKAEMIIVAKAIRARRKRAGLTLSQLADMAEIDAGFLAYIENGKKTPSLGTLLRIAESLGVSAASLFGSADGHGDGNGADGGPRAHDGVPYEVHVQVRALARRLSKQEQQDFVAVLRHLNPRRARALRVFLGK